MAGFVVSPNTIRVLIHFSLHGRPQLHVMHAQYNLAGPLGPNIAEQIFAAAKADPRMNGALAALGTHFSFTGVSVIDLRSANNVAIESTGAAVPGTEIAVALPDQVSIVITLRTEFAGRSFRGRVYAAGWTAAAMSPDGTIADEGGNAAQAWVQALQAGIGASGGVLAIRSPALPERPSKPGGTLPAKDFAITPV